MNKILKAFKDPCWAFGVILRHCLSRFIKDDRTFIRLEYFSGMGKFPDLDNPRRYNEKIQWLKLNDIHPEYAAIVDKSTAKDYVASKIGESYIVPTLGVWDRFDDIDFDALPRSFVLKTTHDSGGVAVCADKASFDVKGARKKLEKSLRHNFYFEHREYPYKGIKPRIIAEAFIGDGSGLDDYKFFIFNGKCRMLFVATGRLQGDTRFNFFDENFNQLPFTQGHPLSDEPLEKPENFDEMVRLAEELGKDFRHVRVDLYNVGGKIYFGELTFFHYSGNVPFVPDEWDFKVGEWLEL